MTKIRYSTKTKKVWEKAPECSCGHEDCNPKNHRLCGKCGGLILYGSHSSEQTQMHSKYAWHLDHIKPIKKGGTDQLSNLYAVHIDCKRLEEEN